MLDYFYKIFTIEEKNFFEQKINEAENLINKNNLDLNYYVHRKKFIKIHKRKNSK